MPYTPTFLNAFALALYAPPLNTDSSPADSEMYTPPLPLLFFPSTSGMLGLIYISVYRLPPSSTTEAALQN